MLSPRRMHVAAYQGPQDPGSVADMLAALDRAAADAARAGARLLVAPELFLTGYNIGADALAHLAEPQDGPSAQAAAAIARRHDTALLYGYPERAPDGRLYNAALLIGRDGRPRAHYRKLHLWGDMERATFTPGEDPFVLADIDGTRLGILICYDVEFPEMVRGLALHGADLVAVPTALMRPYEFVAGILVRARAYENQLAVIYANRCGTEGDLTYTGQSCIIGPDGRELARADDTAELITAALEPGHFAQARRLNTHLQDRLPAHYAAMPSRRA